MQKNLYTISASSSFIDVLASGIMRKYGDDPLLLSRITILLPNRRSCRMIQDAFLLQNDNKPMILPSIRAIGDVDESIIDDGSILPAISSVRRKILLTNLIHRCNKNIGIEQAAHLCTALTSFLDEVLTYNLSFDSLENLAPEELAEHWLVTIDFFKTLSCEWPKILKKQGVIEQAERRNLLLARQVAIWKENPPKHPVIAAGSTGSIPATSALLKTILQRPEGYVVLPSLDMTMNEKLWKLLDDEDYEEESHSQFGLKKLLGEMNVNRSDVMYFEEKYMCNTFPQKKNPHREQFMKAVMCPSYAENTWKDVSFNIDAIDGISLIEAKNIQHESTIIALMMREVLEEKGKTAALITHNRNLAKRVAIMLKKWGIIIDDSAGKPLSETPQIVFMKLIAEMIDSDFSPVAMLSALKHPFASCGLSRREFKQNIRWLEKNALRGVRIKNGMEGIYSSLESKPSWLVNIEKEISCFAKLMKSNRASLKDLIINHILCAEKLASTNEKLGEKILWSHENGIDAANYLKEMIDSTNDEGDIDTSQYAGLFEALFDGETCHKSYGTHTHLSILSPMEARLKSYNLMILGGMNSGSWPRGNSNIWMSRPMMKEFGLPSTDRKTGLSAHDFYCFSCADNVIFTRSEKEGGAPAIASPWLLRMEAVLEKSGLNRDVEQKKSWKEWADSLNMPDSFITIKPPSPCPDVFNRPKKLSATNIQTLIRDPYSIYAKYILNLHPIDELDEEPDAADFGNLIHETMDNFIKNHTCGTIDNLLYEGRKVFEKFIHKPAVKNIWWSRFTAIANCFISENAERMKNLIDIKTEIKGEIKLLFENNDYFIITAKADRIEMTNNEKIKIIDYKTGFIPTIPSVKNGLSPQLAIEAIIAESGGFRGISGVVDEIGYWKLSSNIASVKKDSRWINTSDGKAIKETKDYIINLIKVFYEADTKYISCPDKDIAPKFNDYTHLARVKEWL